MATWAWANPETGDVHRIVNDDVNPQDGSRTGVPRGARKVDVVFDLPGDFPAPHSELLGPGEHRLADDGVVHVTFPQADFSDDAVRRALVRRVEEALVTALVPLLAPHIVRGTSVPDDVHRQVVRLYAKASSLEGQIADLPVKDAVALDLTVA